MTATVITRRIGSVPVRTGTETWHAIVSLIAEPGSEAQTRLNSITGIAAMLIAETYTQEAPVIIIPSSGSRVRVYTVHGDEAEETTGDETALAYWPTSDTGWSISLPCGSDDLGFASARLASTPEITVRDLVLGISLDNRDQTVDVRDPKNPVDLRVDTSWLEA
jgi:hypothetical protein